MPAERRRVLAVKAAGAALDDHGIRLPVSLVLHLADRVLDAIEPELEHCTHYQSVHNDHHQSPVPGCPWCNPNQ